MSVALCCCGIIRNRYCPWLNDGHRAWVTFDRGIVYRLAIMGADRRHRCNLSIDLVRQTGYF
jgi:hypothetical protein